MTRISSIESRGTAHRRRAGTPPPPRKDSARGAANRATPAPSLARLRATARALWAGAERRPAPVAFAVMLALTFASLLAVHFGRGYNSDDVAVQTVLANWRAGDPHTATLGPDNFLIKAPVYLLVGALLPNSPAALLVTAFILNLIGFGLFFLAYRHLLGRAPALVAYLPLLWLASFGGGLFSILINPNLRNAEVGLAFLILALAAGYGAARWEGRGRQQRIALGVAAAVGLGLFVYSDPAFLFLLIVPLILALAVLFVIRRDRRELLAALVLAAAVPLGRAWDVFFLALHLKAAKAVAAPAPLDQLGDHLRLAYLGQLRLFDADALTAPALWPQGLERALDFALLALIFAAPPLLWLARRRLAWQPAWWHWFILAQPYYVVAVYAASSQVAGLSTARYMFLVPFYGAIILGMLVVVLAERPRLRRTLAGALLGGALLHLAITVPLLARGDQRPNARHTTIVQIARAHGLTKGYARYWSGNINTYFSGDQIQFIPTVCRPDGLHVYHWLLDDRVLALPAGGRTFYVYEDNAPPDEVCPPRMLREQLGPPAQVIRVDAHTQLFVYDGDITSRIYPH